MYAPLVKCSWNVCEVYVCEPKGLNLIHHAIPYHTIPYHTIPYHTIPYHTIPCHTMPYHAIPCHTIPYHTLPCHTMPYSTVPYCMLHYTTLHYNALHYTILYYIVLSLEWYILNPSLSPPPPSPPKKKIEFLNEAYCRLLVCFLSLSLCHSEVNSESYNRSWIIQIHHHKGARDTPVVWWLMLRVSGR